VLVIVSPGQGAQSAGFLADWLESSDFAEPLKAQSETVEIDLAYYGTEASDDTIRATEIAQPLLIGSALAACHTLGKEAINSASALSGHSVGELAAAAIAGTVSHHDAGRLVRCRGDAMAAAAAASQTSMTAILGGDRELVLAAIKQAGATPANDNGPGQVVAAGTVEQLQALAETPPPKARLLPLKVAGAFHTKHMEPAVARLAALAATISVSSATVPVISNRDGALITDGADILNRIVGQVAHPVRWDLCMQQMFDLGVTGVLELPPAGTLTGIFRRALKGVETFALKSPDQIADAQQFCRAHATQEVLP
jgi:[acyl-carrier-protein] S-malonyltransferase